MLWSVGFSIVNPSDVVITRISIVVMFTRISPVTLLIQDGFVVVWSKNVLPSPVWAAVTVLHSLITTVEGNDGVNYVVGVVDVMMKRTLEKTN